MCFASRGALPRARRCGQMRGSLLRKDRGHGGAFVLFFSDRGLDEGLPIGAARRAAPMIDDLACWQVRRTRRRGDDVTAGGTGIGALRRRATVLMIGRSSGPATFKLSANVHGIDEGVHGTAPVGGREHQHLSVTRCRFAATSDAVVMVSWNPIDGPRSLPGVRFPGLMQRASAGVPRPLRRRRTGGSATSYQSAARPMVPAGIVFGANRPGGAGAGLSICRRRLVFTWREWNCVRRQTAGF